MNKMEKFKLIAINYKISHKETEWECEILKGIASPPEELEINKMASLNGTWKKYVEEVNK